MSRPLAAGTTGAASVLGHWRANRGEHRDPRTVAGGSCRLQLKAHGWQDPHGQGWLACWRLSCSCLGLPFPSCPHLLLPTLCHILCSSHQGFPPPTLYQTPLPGRLGQHFPFPSASPKLCWPPASLVAECEVRGLIPACPGSSSATLSRSPWNVPLAPRPLTAMAEALATVAPAAGRPGRSGVRPCAW